MQDNEVVRRELENIIVRKQRHIESLQHGEEAARKEIHAMVVDRDRAEQEVAEIEEHLLSLLNPLASVFEPTTAPDTRDGHPEYLGPDHETVIVFSEDAVKEYLDEAIRSWRRKRDGRNIEMQASMASEKVIMARHYIDAYQSVRTSLFGDLLE